MEHFPYEIWHLILPHLNLKDLKKVSRTSKWLRSLCSDSILHQAPEIYCSWKCPYIIQKIISHRCGKLLTKRSCKHILYQHNERLVDFLYVIDGKYISQNTVNNAFLFACEYGLTKSLYLMMQDRKKIRCNQKMFVVESSILPDPSTNDNYAIRLASRNGHVKISKYLLNHQRVDPSADNNYAIRLACENGHIEVVKLLLTDSRVDPGADDNYAIQLACKNGHIEVVKLLLSDSR
ncbi:hypothetical protein ROZALSC1DRAFT_26003, partial [Rozella allomycis CSF55]